MRLVHKDTGEPARLGEMLTDSKGGKAKLLTMTVPRTPASTGRVYVEWDAETEDDRFRSEYFPSVFGLEWIEREDRPVVCSFCDGENGLHQSDCQGMANGN